MTRGGLRTKQLDVGWKTEVWSSLPPFLYRLDVVELWDERCRISKRNKTTQKIKDRSKSLFSEWHWSGFFEADHNLAFFFFSTFQVDLRPGRASFGIVPQISESLGPVCHSNVFQPNLEANNDETFWDETNLCNFEIVMLVPRGVQKQNWTESVLVGCGRKGAKSNRNRRANSKVSVFLSQSAIEEESLLREGRDTNCSFLQRDSFLLDWRYLPTLDLNIAYSVRGNSFSRSTLKSVLYRKLKLLPLFCYWVQVKLGKMALVSGT